jgi:energy-coupling factor transport system permease protein
MTAGAYRPGNSFLHRVDPRVKLVLIVGIIACLFSTVEPQRLILIALLWFVVAAGTTTQCLADVRWIIKVLRWLLLFTLLLHLFFTPGRTLFGTSWLSYDGLVRGLMIDSQLLLAVLFSLLLAWTTRPESLAAGLTVLLAPLQRFKVPVKEAGGMLLLVLHFFPLIQSEIVAVKAEQKKNEGALAGFRGWLHHLEPLLHRLLDRVDQLAHEIVAGSDISDTLEQQNLLIFDRTALVAAIGGLAVIFLLWQV